MSASFPKSMAIPRPSAFFHPGKVHCHFGNIFASDIEVLCNASKELRSGQAISKSLAMEFVGAFKVES